MSRAPSQDRAAPSGAHFMAWLRQSIQTRKLIINDAKALVHTVAGTTYLVSPGVFQRYAQEYLQVAALAKQEKLERSEEHTSELQSLMRISYAVFCLKKKP